jgi:outer membrane murein-binding lipoprotein Lpp
MNPQLQLWMPAVLSMYGASIVVVLTGWVSTKKLSAQLESVRAELHAEIAALRAEMKQGFAELRLEFHQQFTEFNQRVERLEEARGLVRP